MCIRDRRRVHGVHHAVISIHGATSLATSLSYVSANSSNYHLMTSYKDPQSALICKRVALVKQDSLYGRIESFCVGNRILFLWGRKINACVVSLISRKTFKHWEGNKVARLTSRFCLLAKDRYLICKEKSDNDCFYYSFCIIDGSIAKFFTLIGESIETGDVGSGELIIVPLDADKKLSILQRVRLWNACLQKLDTFHVLSS
eukprot:TRINITY_DN287_c0_g2_i2.p1 TRINITY_DN287_c0_g2~~TRINITY_DN287_c0_g2_i2.p1  ORF type:complete len:202 (-),score=7.29 TRINITY_DN287_c0_g2_i2:61-666(-)